jgi:hypothetical protein
MADRPRRQVSGGWDDALLEGADKLKWIQSIGVGYNQVMTSSSHLLVSSSSRHLVGCNQSEKGTKLAQKLGQLQPFIAVSPQECMGQLAYFGPI